MFGSRHSRLQDAQDLASDAWDHLTRAIEYAGDAGRTVGRRTEDAADEAQRRARNAYGALLGHRDPRPWGWIAAAGAVGLAVGWAAATSQRMLREEPASFTPEQTLDGVPGSPPVT